MSGSRGDRVGQNRRGGIARAAALLVSLTAVGQVLGLVRDAVIAAVFGARAALDAYLDVFVPTTVSGPPRDSVVNMTAVVTIDRMHLGPPVGLLPLDLMRQVDQGLRLVLGL